MRVGSKVVRPMGPHLLNVAVTMLPEKETYSVRAGLRVACATLLRN